MRRIVNRVSGGSPPRRLDWSDVSAVAALAEAAGLLHEGTFASELAIRARSPEAYVDSGQDHPMSIATRPLLERSGVADEVRAAMTTVLREANEDPDAFLVHSPYVVHELRRL